MGNTRFRKAGRYGRVRRCAVAAVPTVAATLLLGSLNMPAAHADPGDSGMGDSGMGDSGVGDSGMSDASMTDASMADTSMADTSASSDPTGMAVGNPEMGPAHAEAVNSQADSTHASRLAARGVRFLVRHLEVVRS